MEAKSEPFPGGAMFGRFSGAWSAAAGSVWGKTDRDHGSWLPLVQHLEDAASVAGLLWDEWVPSIVRRRLAGAIGDEDAARTVTVFLAGVHDVGKATPAFAQLAHDVGMSNLVSTMEREGLRSPTLPRLSRPRHTLTGHVALAGWLEQRYAWEGPRADALASVVSSHHGIPAPEGDALRHLSRDEASLGDGAWTQVREEILDTMCELTNAGPVLGMLKTVKLRLPVLVDLVALVVMADWIASDTTRFPYGHVSCSTERLEQARRTLDLRAPWQPREFDDSGEAFAEAFPHLSGASPTALQKEAWESGRAADPGSLMVIEAPTGSGKSEAALVAAEAMAQRSGAGGAFVALPTMATSNAMFGRVLSWVDAWPGTEDPALWLAHGKAGLNDDFAGLVRGSKVAQVHDDDRAQIGARSGTGAMRVSEWFSGRRKGLLANVVVGTIDQVLMGALQARHLALRHLALSSKVVIIDEVHATDVYMRSYLHRMLTYLGAYGTPVILLSATLPVTQRDGLVQAYRDGRAAMTQPQPVGLRVRGASPEPAPAAESAPPQPSGYPLITLAGTSTTHTSVEQDQSPRTVRLEPLDDNLEQLAERLRLATADGGCVAVIRNTVRRAQETFDALAQVFGEDVRLFHSRFVALDRAARERALVDRLGPTGERPRRLIVVGTQVLEQSLDLDVDLLVSDLAPVDLLIQRCGRLHRHPRPSSDRPETLRSAQCWVTGVEDWSTPVPRAVGGSRAVYAETLLLRSAAVLRPYLEGRPLTLPEEVPALVAEAFDEATVPPAGWETQWLQAADKAQSKDDASRSKAGVFQVDPPTTKVALTGWVTTPAQEDRDETKARAQVRNTEDGIEVIVVVRDGPDSLRLPDGSFDGARRQIPYQPDDHDQTTRLMAGCTVSLPQELTNPGVWDQTIGELEANAITDQWQDSRWLAGQLALVLDAGTGSDPASTVLHDRLVTYDATRGLTVTRHDLGVSA